MISSFLRSINPDEAVGVDLGDVAGVQPAVSVDRLGGPLRIVAVAEHHELAAHEQLAVLRELHLDAGRRRADGADPDVARAVDRPARARLRHRPTAPRARSRARGRTPAPRPASARRRRGRRAPGRGRASPRSCENICSSACADPRLELRRDRLAALAEPHTLERRRERLLARSPAARAGCAACIASSPAFSFSQMRGHREEPVRPHPRQERDDILRGFGQTVIVPA